MSRSTHLVALHEALEPADRRRQLRPGRLLDDELEHRLCLGEQARARGRVLGLGHAAAHVGALEELERDEQRKEGAAVLPGLARKGPRVQARLLCEG
jgi:hypothetical protein